MHPILFQIGPFPIYTYGVLAAAAMLTVLLMLPSRAQRAGIEVSAAVDALLFLFVAGVFGARLFYVLQHFDEYAAEPLKILSLREGGLVWYGGFIVSASLGLCYGVRRGWPLLKFCDFFSPLLALAHGIGRLGCFFNGCCWGRETDSVWGIAALSDTVARHPVQLYEAGALFLLALWLDRLSIRPGRREGSVFIAYVLSYSSIRFGLEFLRADQERYAAFTLPQWTSLVLFLGALFLYFTVIRRRGKN